MSEFESETTGSPRRPPASHVALVSILGGSVGVLLVAAAVPVIRDTLTAPGGTMQALAIVGVILAEAIALYVCYGALIAIVEPSIRERLGGDTAWNSSD